VLGKLLDRPRLLEGKAVTLRGPLAEPGPYVSYDVRAARRGTTFMGITGRNPYIPDQPEVSRSISFKVT